MPRSKWTWPSSVPETERRPRGRAPRPAPPEDQGQERVALQPTAPARRPRVVDHEVIDQYRTLEAQRQGPLRQSRRERIQDAWTKSQQRAWMKTELEYLFVVEEDGDQRRESLVMTINPTDGVDNLLNAHYAMGEELRNRFVIHLDQQAGYRLGLQAAWERLQEEKPELAIVVARRYVHGDSVAAVAQDLEIGERSVKRHAADGLDLLVQWTGTTVPTHSTNFA